MCEGPRLNAAAADATAAADGDAADWYAAAAARDDGATGGIYLCVSFG